jgi:hypothetical protein
VESRQSLCRLQMDSGLMIQKYTNFVVFNVDSTWTEWSPSGLHWSPGGVQPECVGECKVHGQANARACEKDFNVCHIIEWS